ncbi:hypothetical protein EPUL_000549 [Erysiphe pulchra]|uniref:Uncharacterized protein n=1 Tax=Erysiphe pulchra TaxID=225359 RepID=A0A2S4PWY1_9PEZI|nr:hypothetical protein EPUL_000549 [Erysiphe pulchra]
MEPKNRPLIDPDCAICGAPGLDLCMCEGLELEAAVNRAEELMLTSCLDQIREWVKIRARNFILVYYDRLAYQHEREYSERINEIEHCPAHYYNSREYFEELDREEARLKHYINEAWKASVQRYPEVLRYFYSLVDISRPNDSDVCVTSPPIYPDDVMRPSIPMNARTREGENAFRSRSEIDRQEEQEYRARSRRRPSERYSDQEREETIPRSERIKDTRGDYRSSYYSRSKKYGMERD